MTNGANDVCSSPAFQVQKYAAAEDVVLTVADVSTCSTSSTFVVAAMHSGQNAAHFLTRRKSAKMAPK